MISVDASYLAVPLLMEHGDLCEMTLIYDDAVAWIIGRSSSFIKIRRLALFVEELARYELCFRAHIC